MKKVIFILILFLFSGCDLTDTRDAELPDTRRNNRLTPSTPDVLFLNLKNSLKEKVLENYMANFADNSFSNRPFIFIPSSESVASFPGLATWDIQSEQQYFTNLIVGTKDNIPIILDLQNEIKSNMGDSAIYQYDYILSLTPNNENLSSSYRGNLKFYIYLDSNNLWFISRWEDIKVGDNPTWSALKGALY